MTETTGPEENEVADAPTTPEKWRVFLERYGELHVKLHDDQEELAALLDEDQMEALEQDEGVEVWLAEDPARVEALAASEERFGVRFPAAALPAGRWGIVCRARQGRCRQLIAFELKPMVAILHDIITEALHNLLAPWSRRASARLSRDPEESGSRHRSAGLLPWG
ncbi:hypothetical protein [Streptomyces sp. NBC_01185]|uniref:hypothetical protein n=1 Tax=Streptomyces sp. NBC_01185 TaxID=2903764 RepID=UPI00386AA558|nr:hypothetical protein OG770_33010 [Streptomyces sp. NBC_01185]